MDKQSKTYANAGGYFKELVLDGVFVYIPAVVFYGLLQVHPEKPFISA
jgi:hypothetical protein